MSPPGGGSMHSAALVPQTEEQTQLDEILNELLGDELFSGSGSTQGTMGRSGGSVMPNYGSLTTQSGNSRTIVSWQTQQSGPTNTATVSKHTVSQPSPLEHEQSYHSQRRELTKDGYSFSSSRETRSEKHSESTTFDGVGSAISPLTSPLPQRYHSVPYKIDYENQ